MKELKVKKLHKDAIIPAYQPKGAAGFDFHPIEDAVVIPRTFDSECNLEMPRTTVGASLTFEIPEGCEIEVRGRSGLAFKYHIQAFNGTVNF